MGPKIWNFVSKSAIFGGFWSFDGNLDDWCVLFFLENGKTNWCRTSCENRTSGKNPVLELWALLGEFWNFSEIKNDPKMVFSSNFTKYSHVIYRWSTNSTLITDVSKNFRIFPFLAEKWLKRTPKISKILNFT